MDNNIYENVKEYYGKILKTTKSLKTSACTMSNRPSDTILNILKKIPNEIKNKFYGCGSTIPMGIDNLRILDLGSGSGQDCYIVSALVGENGYVVGVDMTDEQLDVSNKYIDEYTKLLNYKKPNMEFKKGYIECLDKLNISPSSIDIVISNCVVNLSPKKDKVIEGVYNLLKEGGSFYFSDVYSDRRLDESITNNEILWAECIGGALYIEDFKRICNKFGFKEIREVERTEIFITDDKLKNIIGNARFYSITYNLFKIDSLETLCEDYGQYAIYNGNIKDKSHFYILDNHHKFITNKPMLVCGNTADMLSKSWLSKYFTVYGDKSVHYGLFKDCSLNEENIEIKSSCC
tara:strand:+ start:354 stop:1397 length:1044 start_codon:yes stop_codon:yes gene_type:complete